MTKEFTFEDLLKEPAQRVMKAHIEGLGVVTLTEFTSAELETINSEALALSEMQSEYDTLRAAEDSPEDSVIKELEKKIADTDKSIVSRWAARLLSGKKCSQEEVDKISGNLSPGVRQEVYLRGLQFNVRGDSYREHIEKNS